ncbi:hypothetical protein [Pragia fontium]|uniref:hypothetical protein n=1 Tax=Pragia fontium TaxID=82985 RepID=UPI00069A1D03|nr:hypothetical protein [Pragia fontium]
MGNVAYADFTDKTVIRRARMENQKQGHFALFRSVLSKDWSKDTAKLALWIRLIGKASYKPRSVSFANRQWDLLPGQLVTTPAILARELRDSNGEEKSSQAVTRMLKFFVREQMITMKGNPFGTVICITKYVEYQAGLADKPSDKPSDKPKASDTKASKAHADNPSDKPSDKQNKKVLEQELNTKTPLTPQGGVFEAAQVVLDYYNELNNSRCSATAPFEKALTTVKSKGQCYSVDEIKLVLRWISEVWKHKAKPENIFRMTRFDGYLSDALIWNEGADRNPVACPHAELIELWNKSFPDRPVESNEWNRTRPAYKNLERVWNIKTNKGGWREVKHMNTIFTLLRQSSLCSKLDEKPWLSLDWILQPKNWSAAYEQAKQEYRTRNKGAAV